MLVIFGDPTVGNSGAGAASAPISGDLLLPSYEHPAEAQHPAVEPMVATPFFLTPMVATKIH